MITGNRSFFESRCRQRGYTLDEVRACIVSDDGEFVTVDELHPAYPRATHGPTSGGPGAELHALLRDWMGIVPNDDCPCRSMAARMDALGPDWCESDAGMAEILGVMRAEHAKRLESGETRLPWTDFGATQLVRLACRRARAKASA